MHLGYTVTSSLEGKKFHFHEILAHGPPVTLKGALLGFVETNPNAEARYCKQ